MPIDAPNPDPIALPAETPEAEPRERWLVGIDGSAPARRALEWAAGVARGRPVAIRAVGAWQYPFIGVLPLAGGGIPAAGEGMEEEIGRQVAALAAATSAAFSVPIQAVTAMGPAAQVLLDAAEEAELVVLGSRGRGGFARLMLGSVSHQLACHSPRPTIIVPPEATHGPLKRVVVGVDGSESSYAALRWAHRFVLAETELIAFHAWEFPPTAAEVIDTAATGYFEESAQQTLDQAVDGVEAKLGVPGRFTRVIEGGHPGRRLVEHGDGADLLVVGARGHHGLAAAVVGSTTTWVVHHLPCPTAVIPRP